MPTNTVRWLLDVGLPAGPYRTIDALSAQRISRAPGPAGLSDAIALDRTLVTYDQEFRGPWSLGFRHPGLVVFETPAGDAADLERNLRHVEFIIGKLGRNGCAGCRFVVRPDCEVREVRSNGREVELEPWRTVRVQAPIELKPLPLT